MGAFTYVLQISIKGVSEVSAGHLDNQGGWNGIARGEERWHAPACTFFVPWANGKKCHNVRRLSASGCTSVTLKKLRALVLFAN